MVRVRVDKVKFDSDSSANLERKRSADDFFSCLFWVGPRISSVVVIVVLIFSVREDALIVCCTVTSIRYLL